MQSETINTGLKKYGIGDKLRRLRLRKSMGLSELGKHTGLSPALLSKLERNVMHPTLPTLSRISLVFGVGLEHFFKPETQPILEIVRKKTACVSQSLRRSRNRPTISKVSISGAEPSLNSYLAEFENAEPADDRPHSHPGVEFLYILSGKLLLRTNNNEYGLSEGDSIYFDSEVPHSYCKIGSRRTTAIVVTTGA